MKQSLKYGLFLVLALLICVVSNEIIKENCKAGFTTYGQKKCYVSQNHPVRNALEHLYHFYTTQSCDLSHIDVVHVPAEKSVELLITTFYEYKDTQNPPQVSHLPLPKSYYDPVTYYIYGLRKIII